MPSLPISPSEAAETAVKVVDMAERISKALDRIHALKKEGQGVYIKVPDKICQYDVIVRIQKSGIISKNMTFALPEVENVVGTCMPSLQSLHNSIIKTEEGFCLPLESVPEGTDYILLQFQYKISGSDFISNLIEYSVGLEPQEYSDRDEYWMHAALKFPQILEKAYKYLKLEEIDLKVDVAVDNELKTAVPGFVTKGLRNIRKLLAQSDRNLAQKALMNYLQSRRQIGTDVYSLMEEISSIFWPTRFRKFIDITPPFRYHESMQGTDFYDFPGQALPKAMTVISRTDLSLQEPAKEGKVIYRKKELFSELEKIFK